MSPHLARHEQFLRIWKLLQHLDAARHPVADSDLLDFLKDSLGLTRLSVRTLGRDCEFLASCGYPIQRVATADGQRQGWQLLRTQNQAERWKPAEPLTLLEVVATLVAQEQLRFAEGSILWTGMRSVVEKILTTMPAMLTEQVTVAAGSWHVVSESERPYEHRPRLLSLLATAVTSTTQVEFSLRPQRPESSPVDGQLNDQSLLPNQPAERQTFLPHGFVVQSPSLGLIGFWATQNEEPAVLIDLGQIESAVDLKKSFVPNGKPVSELFQKAVWPDGQPVNGHC